MEKEALKCTSDMYHQLMLDITLMLLKRTDLKSLTVMDVLHDTIMGCKENTLAAYLLFAKKIINKETTYVKLLNLTIEQLQDRRIFQKKWLQDAMINLPGYKEKCKIRNLKWWRFQIENKTPQWVQINLNKIIARLDYKIKQYSTGPIFCKIHNCICTRLAERHNNHQTNGCQKAELFTLKNTVCFPKNHPNIPKDK